MGRKINQTGLEHIKQWEGLRTKAYQCPGGQWTIGYGHTAAAGKPAPVEGMTITAEAAEDLLRRDLAPYENAVASYVRVCLTDNRFAVLVSFTYNVGIDAFRRSSLLRKLNDGLYEEIPAELMKWVYCGKRSVSGLANRRAAEAGLWVKGAYVASRTVEPEIKKQRALMMPETIGPLVGALAGAGSIVSGSGPVQWALSLIMIVSCCAGAWYFIRRMRQLTM